FSDLVRHHEAGTIPPTVMWGACPTRFDPTQAPPNCHTAFMWEKLPYRLRGRPPKWGKGRAGPGPPILALLEKHAPTLSVGVIGSFTRSPLDVERALPNMREGDLLVGARSNRLQPAVPGCRRIPHASARALSVRIEQSSRREYHRPARVQCFSCDLGGPRHQE